MMKTVFRYIVRFFSSFDRYLLLLLALTLSIGLLNLYSASLGVMDKMQSQIQHIVIAALLMCWVSFVPTQTLMKIAVPIYSLGLLLLLAVMLFGTVRNGAKRWLYLGLMTLQPSELMKIAVPLLLAWYFQKREECIRVLDYCIAFFLLLLPTLLIINQPDLGTALLVFASGAYVIFFAGISWRFLVPVFLLILIVIVLSLLFSDYLCTQTLPFLHDYQKQRICTLLNPESDPLGRGFHTIQAMIAIGSGGIFGKGWLNGTQSHLGFIPEKHTDFVFAVYAEEFGLAGSIVLFLLYIALIWRALYIASIAATFFERLLASSIALTLFTYAFVNIAMTGGILPIVGMPLPFLSYGGSAMVTQGLIFGVLFNIMRHRRLVPT